MAVGGRVTGKSSVVASAGGNGTANINEDIIWLTVCVGVIILVLITMALCYLLHERCQRKRATVAWNKDPCPFHLYQPSDGYYIDV